MWVDFSTSAYVCFTYQDLNSCHIFLFPLVSSEAIIWVVYPGHFTWHVMCIFNRIVQPRLGPENDYAGQWEWWIMMWQGICKHQIKMGLWIVDFIVILFQSKLILNYNMMYMFEMLICRTTFFSELYIECVGWDSHVVIA